MRANKQLQPTEMFCHFGQHLVWLQKHPLVLKAQYSNAAMAQKQVTLCVVPLCCLAVVGSAILFDGQTLGRTVKIENVSANTVLSTEFPARQLGALEMSPQPGFGRGEVVA